MFAFGLVSYYNTHDNIMGNNFQGDILNMSNIFNVFEQRAREIKGKTLVFPEGDEPRVSRAVKKLLENNMCKVVVLGDEKILNEMYENHELLAKIDPKPTTEKQQKYAQELYELRKHKGLTEEQACSIITDVNYYGCMMLKLGDADGLVSGAITTSADVMRPAFQIIKQKKEISIASSCFIMEIPENKVDILGENGLMVLADCAVVPYPDEEGLHAIAESSIETAKNICGMTPRVSFLSYTSNTAKTTDETTLKIKAAAKRTQEKHPELVIEGELQADASLNAQTAKTKVPNSKIAGRANVLIFPDLNAGNIGYKLIQQFSGVKAVGPIIQGLNKPVNDLSRGATDEEIYLTSLITLIQAEC